LEKICYLAAESPSGVAALIKATSLTKAAALVASEFEDKPFPHVGAIIAALVRMERTHPLFFLDIRVVMASRPSRTDRFLSNKQ
jgi:hypothetical protein